MRYNYIINRAIRLHNSTNHNCKQFYNFPTVNCTPSSSPVVGWLTVAIPTYLINLTPVSTHYKEFPQSTDRGNSVPSFIEKYADQHKHPDHRTGFILSRCAAMEGKIGLLLASTTTTTTTTTTHCMEKSSDLLTPCITTTQIDNTHSTVIPSHRHIPKDEPALLERGKFSKTFPQLGLSYSHEYSAGAALLWCREKCLSSFVPHYPLHPSLGTTATVVAAVDVVSIDRISDVLKRRPTFVSRWLPHLQPEQSLDPHKDIELTHCSNSNSNSSVSEAKGMHLRSSNSEPHTISPSSHAAMTAVPPATNDRVPSVITIALHWCIRECVVKILGENNRSVCMKDCSVVTVNDKNHGIGNKDTDHEHLSNHGQYCKCHEKNTPHQEHSNTSSDSNSGILTVMVTFVGVTLERLKEKGILSGNVIVQWETVVTLNETLLVATAWASSYRSY